jgi:AI-2E family transporter
VARADERAGAQGLLGGLAFWAVGIDGAIFWGTVMTVLSIIPGVGDALVSVPAAIILITTGEIWRGIALAGFCGLVIGSVDNLLRPLLVGRDSRGPSAVRRDGVHPGPRPDRLPCDGVGMFGSAFRSSLADRRPVRELVLVTCSDYAVRTDRGVLFSTAGAEVDA